MNLISAQSVLGAMVLATGLVAVGTAATSRTTAADSPTTSVATLPVIVELPAPTVDGIDPAIQRVLSDAGRVEVLAPTQVSGLPVSVARVLAYYHVTLTIPVTDQGSRSLSLRVAP